MMPYQTLKFPKSQIDTYLVGYLNRRITLSLLSSALFLIMQHRLVLEFRY